MRLRTALNEYKRDRGRRFPEECQTSDGAFSGHGDRLVYVGLDGSLRDYSSSLSGLYGIDRSRFGIETNGETHWFDELEPVRQHYYHETSLVETEYDAGEYTVHQYDLTLGRAHVTHVELRGAIPTDAHLTAFLTFAPEGRETRVGRLIHEEGGPNGTQAVEVFHRTEHDYVTASTGLDDVRGQIPERFDEILSDDTFDFPREAVLERYEDTHLSGDVVVSAPLEQEGRAARTTLVTQLSDHSEMDRSEALADLQHCSVQHATADDLRSAAREQAEVFVPDETPRERIVRTDLRAISLLTAPSGARIAGPEFDPFYAHSGGYGYTWFRDDAEISLALAQSDDAFDLGLDARLSTSAEFYCEMQLQDGTWPHRVWAVDGSVAPGWAHGRVEGTGDEEYQADQTASVVTYLATLLTERRDELNDELVGRIRSAVTAGISGLDSSLEDDGLPQPCQNAWENMSGRFTHTAAAFLRAYSTVAAAPVPDSLREHAAEQATAVYDGLGELWSEERAVYALRIDDNDKLDDRLDSATFALVDAIDAYADIEEVDTKTADRLVKHMSATLKGLYRNPRGDVAGLVRFEDDYWRADGQEGEKIWSVATAWGANAAAKFGLFCDRVGKDGRRFIERATNLYELLQPDGPLTNDAGYLAEQVFDDGGFDSAVPLGWPHAIRMETTAVLSEIDALPAPKPAPTGPENRPRWTTGEKYGIGTVADHDTDDPSRIWFTLTEGALTEVRFPRVDLMNLRTLDFLVVAADPKAEYTARTHNETRRDDHADTVERRAEIVETDALVFRHTITETGDGRGHEWELTVEYAIDSEHDAVLADVQFESLDGGDYELYTVADTALANTGAKDRGIRLGQLGSYHLVARDAGAFDTGDGDEPLLIDQNGRKYSVAIALTAVGRFEWATVGVAGSRYLSEFFSKGALPNPQERIDDENVVLVGRIGTGSDLTETLALGFAEHADTAAALGEAAGALTRGYETVRSAYTDSWNDFLADKTLPDAVADDDLAAQYKTCLMSLRAVEDKTYLGAGIASPSVPWGEVVPAEEAKGYGYNFVWSRDLYQVFTVFEAVGDIETAIDALEYIYTHQQDDRGFIPQNTYLNGRTRWGGEQMDNISFPQVMAYTLAERGIDFDDVAYDYVNVKRSADYVARNGPPTAQERWEEEAGYSPSSIAAEIAGLGCAAAIALDEGHDEDALVWLSLADDWETHVDDWTATRTGTDRNTHTPYYVRITRDGEPDAGHLRTLANNGPTLDEREIIDGGFLELTRLGIKPADDEIIQNSVAEVDETIRVDTPHGPAFYRYNGDGYGERERDEEGAPWSIDAKGKGRLWPIFTGERGEYELLNGTDEGALEPANLLQTMAAFANSGRMLAEQVWDREHSTDYNWEFGEGTGSATPLAWSMAQFVRLAHSIDAGEPVETPAFLRERYVERDRPSGPKLRVSTRFKGDKLVVSGQTDAAVVAVKTPGETTLIEPEDDAFEVEVAIEYGENQVTVAAATDADLTTAGTSVSRFTL
ncbi:glucoamylase / glycosyl hydrolase [Haloferax mucosum ATCC BAA-1512]|uniref:Glucoamylase / glycosyl hydrolase n=1 Tax=Haloferax mucosum ATCC BAA-1512 TaxID=662479 RepID=M0IPP7_9EURY|nr:glycoside hydrolase family 15 protein [Haloferax mucosum]ELZ98705.1 glucoamylase / glycosyl hydrolase [Haloferax mucosum ATCC BAA-1512]